MNTDRYRTAGNPLRLAVASLLTLVLAGAAAAGAQAWREFGPAPILGPEDTGRAAAIAVSATRANRYYVGGASGGVWQSLNGGRTWIARGDELPGLAIGALAVDPQNDRVLYAGSGEANGAYHSLYGLGLYKSTDRGRTWEVLGEDIFSGLTFSRIVVSPFDSDDIWAAISFAGGTSNRLEGARNHPRRNDAKGVFRSTDGGVTWARVRGGLRRTPASDVQLDPADPNRVFVAHGDPFGRGVNGIYRSTDGGQRFRRLPIGIPGAQIGRIMIAIAPSDPNRIYALAMNPSTRGASGGFSPGGASTLAILRSNDGGDSWSRIFPGNFQAAQGNYNAAIVVHPTNPNIFIVGGVAVLRSIDGGASFTNITPPHVDIHNIVFDAAGRLLTAGDGGIHRSSNLGTTWIPRNRTLGLVQFYGGLSLHPTDPNFILGGTQDNGTNVHVGTRKAWRRVFGGDGGYTAVNQTNATIWFVEFQGTGNLFRSANNGNTFSQINRGIPANDRNCFLPPMVIDPTDPNHMLYGTHRVIESTDGGLNWQPISVDLTGGAPWAIRALVMAPSNPSVVYAATNDGRVLASTDGGRTFTLGLNGLGGWPRVMRQLAVDPANPALAYAADQRFGGRRVFETRNTGASWTPIGDSLPNAPVNSVAVHRDAGNNQLVLAGTDDGVWLTGDGGGSWQRYGNDLPRAPVQDLVVDLNHNRLVASTLGRGVWTVRLPTLNDTASSGGSAAAPLKSTP